MVRTFHSKTKAEAFLIARGVLPEHTYMHMTLCNRSWVVQVPAAE